MARNTLPALLLALTLTDCERVIARRADGETCLFNGDCASPLVCAARRCRAPCRDDRDCHNGWSCRPSIRTSCGDAPCPPPRQRVCVEPGGPEICFADSDCADPSTLCGADEICHPACSAGADDLCALRFGAGARCVTRDAGGAVCEAPAVAPADASVDVGDASVSADSPQIDAPPSDVSLDATRDVSADAARDVSLDVTTRDVDPDATITALGCAVTRRPGACVPSASGCALTALSRSVGHSCAVFEDGSLRCWGDDSNGQLGSPSLPGTCAVPGVSFDGPWRAVAAGVRFTCAIGADTRARCWGSNTLGQCGTGTATPLAIEAPTEVLRDDGTPLSDARAIAASDSHACALIGADGRVACWGSSVAFGTMTSTAHPSAAEVTGLTGAVGLVAGSGVTCAWRADGASFCWGWGNLADGAALSHVSATPVRTMFPSVRAVTMNNLDTCALALDGSVWCVGTNTFGGLGDGSATTLSTSTPRAVAGITDAEDLSASAYATCARRRDGTAWCWGAWPRDFVNPTSIETHATPVATPLAAGATRIYAGGSFGLCAWYGGVDLRCIGAYPGEGSFAVAAPVRTNWTGAGL